ncbi:hypothetical protein M2334_000478 [Sphingobium sp. B11D3D]|nr:hypothetical protein [Sphingobium sp. B12D2B]MCW2368279.1 hypothetical protein [Sphingobium sp. B11D3D]
MHDFILVIGKNLQRLVILPMAALICAALPVFVPNITSTWASFTAAIWSLYALCSELLFAALSAWASRCKATAFIPARAASN